ncbi:Serine/threonine protein kinase [Nonomuraea solani]|uniref:Serine/threonine protein kinase n=1 Tax=Nonomuraea solani TaxID=1144553 RepID=A0A1H5TRD6_9ACTN|nr:serine/threonine-protein kinase [Nonomuraea solani]SEF64651.1 Serine/threonine protein kinase [Nonomuraea solani]
MSEITDLRAEDPAEVAGYRLTGRLGRDVFAGTSSVEEAVVVRLLPEELRVEVFLRAMEPLREASAVGTAQILDMGRQDGRAYLVTEFVEGGTLEAAGGSLDGVGLYRLAAGTITALVALHQAGLVHGDIRPGTILLGPDGPRVVDAGLAKALAEAAIATRKVEVPAYTAPERLRGADAESAADVFSWAATMVFAVSGSSPFEGGSMAATVDRITGGEPDLPDLGELHGLIAACLAKDPAARPAASEVLLRLVGQTSFLTGRVEGPAPPVQQTRPPARWREGVPALIAAFAAGALVSGVSVYALAGDRPPPTNAAATKPPTAAAATPTITSSATEAPLEDAEKKAATDTKLPTTGVTLHEHPKDPVRLVAYLEPSDKFTAYARDRSGGFKAMGATEQPMVAPNGDWVALNPMIKFQSSELDQVKFSRFSTGESFVVNTVKKPLQTMSPVWSRDGTKMLLSVHDPESEPRRIVGFVVVDVTARTSVHVETEYTDNPSLPYTFTPDGSIVRGYWDGKRGGVAYYDMSGEVTKTLHWVGLPRGVNWFSPSGKRLATVCPAGKAYCVWDAKTGARLATVPYTDDEGSFLGWFNDKHLLTEEPGKKKGTQVVKIVDFLGGTRRVLADIANDKPFLFQYAPVPRS